MRGKTLTFSINETEDLKVDIKDVNTTWWLPKLSL